MKTTNLQTASKDPLLELKYLEFVINWAYFNSIIKILNFPIKGAWKI
jgi:hypothetical protein